MDIQTQKLILIEQLLHVDDTTIIDQVRDLLRGVSNPVVGYEANGKAITQKDFIKMIEQAEDEVAMGKYQTIEELEKEAESWR
ncbi:MAG: hypothetical protein ACK5RG_16105 [Cyclobacteriaceae bacterium]|jgi:hypothetical protein|nr:hypothetical protein [Flammeovirgaceae bacterium]